MRVPAAFALIGVLVASDARAADPAEQLVAEVEALAPLTQQIVDQLFSYAEIGFEETETARYLTTLLSERGFRIDRGVADIPAAWVATWGSGKPVIGFIADVDGLPGMSQKPGVAYRAPLVEGAPGHGEGHNAGQAVNVTAALALQKLMKAHKLPGTLKLYPGVAEELLATKAFMVRAGLFRGVDVMLGAHVDSRLGTHQGARNVGLISIQYAFHGRSAHSGGSPWAGKSALDAVELMNVGWNFKREHLVPDHRSHYVIMNGGDQPNVVPDEARVWYFFRHPTAGGVRELQTLGSDMARGATIMTGTSFDAQVVGAAWPTHFNKVVAEVQQKRIETVGLPDWSPADEQLARAVQAEVGVNVAGLAKKIDRLNTTEKIQAGSDDIGDVSWALPTVYLRYPANIPNVPAHHWAATIAMATPIAHKGSTAGAKVQALTALDLLRDPKLIEKAWAYHAEQTKVVKYQPLIGPNDRPTITINRDKMERFRPALRRLHFDPRRHKTYLDQLGIKYPTVRAAK